MNGTPPEVLQKLGGWSDLRIVMEHYAFLAPSFVANYANNVRITAQSHGTNARRPA